MAYKSLFSFRLFVAKDWVDIITITKTSYFVCLATFTGIFVITITAVQIRAGAGPSFTNRFNLITLVIRGKEIPTVTAALLSGDLRRRRASEAIRFDLPPE